jgi:hypothetical protein
LCMPWLFQAKCSPVHMLLCNDWCLWRLSTTHEQYKNQFKAIFVRNIGVEWNHEFTYSDKTKPFLIRKPPMPLSHVVYPLEIHRNKCIIRVHCCTCWTQVAALDMEDEVHHFFGCLALAY